MPLVDRRKYSRYKAMVEVAVSVDGQLYPGTVENISMSGIALSCVAPVENGQFVTVELDPIGKIEATVVWTAEEIFAITFTLDAERAETMAEFLTTLVPV